MSKRIVKVFLLIAVCVSYRDKPARAEDFSTFEQQAAALTSTNRATVSQAVSALGRSTHPRALFILESLRDTRLLVNPAAAEPRMQLLIRENESLVSAVTGKGVPESGETLSAPLVNNTVRRQLGTAIARLQLAATERPLRLAAARTLSENPATEDTEALRAALAREADAEVRTALTMALAQLNLQSPDVAIQLTAIEHLRKTGNPAVLPLLEGILARAASDKRVQDAAAAASDALRRKQQLVNQAGNLFYGISLASVLLLSALGLAITFGLMGVINMAHGEMLMLGAYATYLAQNLFQSWLPHYLDWYPLAALPAAFLITAFVGMALERFVIRHLYGRPLETLLATWGISLILIQTVRVLFGAQNVEVANVSWLSGGLAVTPALVLPYSRIAVILFAIFVLASVWLLFQRTALGLQGRAVTQGRSMASCLGVNTRRIDMWTFGIGCGIAGLGGVALSQLGNVGPELGQGYIVDSFMIVVLGGVGKLAGTVAGALGLGVVNKFLEPLSGPVFGKILILAMIVVFIQQRPKGLFALKGHSLES